MDLNEILNLLGGYSGDGGKKQNEFDKFKSMIEKYQMECQYDISEKNGEVVITENWLSKVNKTIKINRIYPFSIGHIELVQTQFRKEIMQKVLDKYVSDENYEAAAQLRDAILEV